MGGRENKRKPHEYSWHPEYGWQLLRRTKSYAIAVDEFIIEAKLAKDYAALALFKKISTPDFYSIKSNTKTVLWNERHEALLTGIHEPSNFGFVFESEYNEQKRLIEEFEIDLYSAKKSSKIKVSFDSSHYKKFNKWYGDVVRFPISPDLIHIHEDVLNDLWVFRPIMIASKNSLQRNTAADSVEFSSTTKYTDLKDHKCSYHIIKVNSNFSAERIRDAVAEYFDKTLFNSENITNKLPWDQDDFDLRISVIDDIREARENDEKIGAVKLSKKYFKKLKQSDTAKKKKMEKIIKYTKEIMLQIFERPRPQSKKNKHT